MTNSVINIKHDINHQLLSNHISSNRIKFIHIEHKEPEYKDKNIIEISRRNPNTKETLVKLTNAGFMTYVLRDVVSSLVHHSAIRNIWSPVKNKEYSISTENVVYIYEEAELSMNKHMVVMFYPIAPNPDSASLNRYFPSNFSSLKKHLSKNYSILRIADLGGISGSFYMNTNHCGDNEKNIQTLINEVAKQHGIDKNNIIMYGVSKGGTGALYHAVLGGYASVAVDPIVDDEHYIKNLGDLHNVNGIFPEEKKEKFLKLLKTENIHSKITIITSCNSCNSEQYPYIIRAINEIKGKILLLNNINPKIKAHTEVAPNSIHAILSSLNQYSFGVPFISGEYNIS